MTEARPSRRRGERILRRVGPTTQAYFVGAIFGADDVNGQGAVVIARPRRIVNCRSRARFVGVLLQRIAF